MPDEKYVELEAHLTQLEEQFAKFKRLLATLVN